jgi:dienelactone hydrolase
MAARRDDLQHAFDRIDDFLAVQAPALRPDAILALQEAVGVDDGARAVIRDRLARLAAAGHSAAAGPVLLGVLVGLFAATAED